MGTTTDRWNLYKPDVEEEDYGEEVNAGFDIIDDMSSRLDIREFLPSGFVTDGSVDYATEINAALVEAYNINSELLLTSGIWLIDSAPLVGNDMVNIIGCGRENTILKAGSSLIDFVIKYIGGGDTATSKKRFRISDLSIFGDDNANPLGGISLDWCYIATIERVFVRRFTNVAAIGVLIDDCFNINLQSTQANLGITGSPQGEAGFKITASGQNTTQIKWDDCLAQFNGIGIMIDDLANTGDGFTITNCGIGKNDTKGISIGDKVQNVRIEQNHIEHHDDAGDFGIYINTGTTDGIRSIAILENQFWQDNTGIYANNVNGIRIDGNVFNGSAGTRDAIDLNSTKRINYGDNNVFSTAYSTVASGSINPRVETFTDQDATPNVNSNGLGRTGVFKTANTLATTITNFDGGINGQVIKVIMDDVNTTIDFTGTNLKGNVGVDWTPTTNDHMTCVKDGTNWYCDISDNTA